MALAYAAQHLHDPAVVTASLEYYGQSLGSHRTSLINIYGSGSTPERGAVTEALPVTVLLSYYEMISATTSEAWIKHTLAAEKLILLLGPDGVYDDFLNHLFYMIRSHTVFPKLSVLH